MRTNLKIVVIFIMVITFLPTCQMSGSVAGIAQTQTPVAQPRAQPEQSERTRADIFSPEADSKQPVEQVKPSVNRKGRRGKNPQAPPGGKLYLRVGVTIGRGRLATETELLDRSIAKAFGKCLERQGGKCVRREEMVVELIPANAQLTHGTPIQMMIEYLAYADASGTKPEHNRIGYLYVINRVQYPDGKSSPPNLIYPARNIFGGDSRVLPGKPVMLPTPNELWQITGNKHAMQAFETYIIIVSPEPLKDSHGRVLQGDALPETSMVLDEKLVARWVRLWGGNIIQSDLERGAGRLFARREQIASGDPDTTSRDTLPMVTDLTPDDPRPQIGFSKVVTPGGRMLVTIKLPFKSTAAPADPQK